VSSPLADPAARPTLGELYRGFFHAGARGFGGVLPWARRMLVEERRWLTAAEFTDLFGLCNFLPGPNTVNMSIVVGARFHGVRGALTALAGILTLPLVVVLALALLYDRFGHLPGIDALLGGVGAAAGGRAPSARSASWPWPSWRSGSCAGRWCRCCSRWRR
jgi:chromate transporter